MRDDAPKSAKTADAGPEGEAPDGRKRAGGEFPGELLIWLSPAFPVGGFAYSHGLETAAARGDITDGPALAEWLRAVIRHGSVRNDLILMAAVLATDDEITIETITELSVAMQPGAERYREAVDQGRSFVAAYHAGWPKRPPLARHGEAVTLPIAVARAARAHGIDMRAALQAYGIAFTSNLVSAAIRLSVVGQFEAQQVLVSLMPDVRHAADHAIDAGIDQLGSAAFGSDLASLFHETQTTRLFRS
ncbi:MAG: urease accessory protein UreF [Alphaproteobacteria bacterium]|nr:urease accessory protein UreF [Alphaproteobacteria bacterium]